MQKQMRTSQIRSKIDYMLRQLEGTQEFPLFVGVHLLRIIQFDFLYQYIKMQEIDEAQTGTEVLTFLLQAIHDSLVHVELGAAEEQSMERHLTLCIQHYKRLKMKSGEYKLFNQAYSDIAHHFSSFGYETNKTILFIAGVLGQLVAPLEGKHDKQYQDLRQAFKDVQQGKGSSSKKQKEMGKTNTLSPFVLAVPVHKSVKSYKQ